MLPGLAVLCLALVASGCALQGRAARAYEKEKLEVQFTEIRTQLDRWCAAGELDAVSCGEYRRRLLDLALVVLMEGIDKNLLAEVAAWMSAVPVRR